MSYRTSLQFLILLTVVLRTSTAFSQSIDLSKSQIFSPSDKATLLRSIEVLQNEVEKRTGIKLPVAKKLPKTTNVILIALESELSKLPEPYRSAVAALPETTGEGFKLVAGPSNTVVIAGKDARGILYGVGRFLRKAEMTGGKLQVDSRMAISTSP